MRRWALSYNLVGLLLVTLLTSLVMAAEPEASIGAFIEEHGGRIARDQSGKIVDVSLARTWATDNDIERVAEIPTLQRLDLSLTYVTDAGIERLQNLAELEDLNLDSAEFITDAAISYLRKNQKLQRLNLRGTDVTDTSLAYVADLTRLRALDISETQISDVGLDQLVSLTELESLSLGGNKISGVGLNVLKLLPRLKTLRFDGVQRRNAGICWGPVITDRELDTIALLTNIEELNIGWRIGLGSEDPALKENAGGEAHCHMVGGIRVTDLGLAKLATMKHLRRLDVSGSQITPTGLKQLRSLPQLESLSAWNIPALDDSVGTELAALPHLTTLDFSYTSIGDNTLRSLEKLRNLRWLYVTETHVTADGVKAFHRTRPECQVSWALRPPASPSAAVAGSKTKRAGLKENEGADEP